MHFVSQHRYRLRCIQSILITLHTLKPTHKSSNAREILQEQTTSQRNIEGLDDYGKILQKLGEIENAIEAFQFSLKLSKESKNEYLIAENTRSLNELKE